MRLVIWPAFHFARRLVVARGLPQAIAPGAGRHSGRIARFSRPELLIIKAAEHPAARQQRCGAAFFDQTAGFDHANLVGTQHCRQAVRDDNGGAAPGQALECFLNQGF
jgi:hypothetical protein